MEVKNIILGIILIPVIIPIWVIWCTMVTIDACLKPKPPPPPPPTVEEIKRTEYLTRLKRIVENGEEYY